MIGNLKKQSGSAHVVIVIILVVALIGALGFMFWQNFTQKGPVATNTKVVQSDTSKNETEELKEELKTYKNASLGYSFQYSGDWELVMSVPAKYETDYEKNQPYKIPFGECSGPFLVNKQDDRQVIILDVSRNSGEGGFCYSYGSFMDDNKWSGQDSWDGSYFVRGLTDKTSNGYYANTSLFNYQTSQVLGKSELDRVSASFEF